MFRRIDADIAKAARQAESPEFNAGIAERARKRMTRVDELPPDLRRCVYEYGLEIVQEFLSHRVTRAKSIAHLIDTVRGSDFKNGQPRFKLNKGPNTKRNPVELADDDEYYVIPKSAQAR